jgi:hypothetical protein
VLIYWAGIGGEGAGAGEGITDKGIPGVVGATEDVSVGVVDVSSRKTSAKASLASFDKAILIEKCKDKWGYI